MGGGWEHMGELRRLFPVADGISSRDKPFSDADFVRISEILEYNGKPGWSRMPRTYTILRLVQAEAYLDKLVAEGGKDISIPYNAANLPSLLPPAIRTRFLQLQHLAFTDVLELEKGAHLCFDSKEGCQFETRAVLGKGACGRVEKVYSRVGQRMYAMKLIRRKEAFKRDRLALENFVKELEASKKVDHRHITKVVGSFTEKSYVGIIMDTIGDCDLGKFLEGEMDASTKSLLRTFFGCLATGLVAIHDAKIRHKDIKPGNILIKGSTVLYTDFGLALDYSQMDRSTTKGRPTMFTAQYCAPEVADWRDRNSSSDMFSLGAVYLEMVSRLNDEKIASLREYPRHNTTSNSTPQYSSGYCKNLTGIANWIVYLKSKQGPADDKLPLAWISAIMKEQGADRLTARELWEHVEESTIQASYPFFCSEYKPRYPENLGPSDHRFNLSFLLSGADDNSTESLTTLSAPRLKRTAGHFNIPVQQRIKMNPVDRKGPKHFSPSIGPDVSRPIASSVLPENSGYSAHLSLHARNETVFNSGKPIPASTNHMKDRFSERFPSSFIFPCYSVGTRDLASGINKANTSWPSMYWDSDHQLSDSGELIGTQWPTPAQPSQASDQKLDRRQLASEWAPTKGNYDTGSAIIRVPHLADTPLKMNKNTHLIEASNIQGTGTEFLPSYTLSFLQRENNVETRVNDREHIDHTEREFWWGNNTIDTDNRINEMEQQDSTG